MELTYLDYLFLDLFSIDEPRKLNALFHILTGKRTVSVLMQALRMNLTAYFALFPKLSATTFDSKMKELIKRGLITDESVITAAGSEAMETYFHNHIKITAKDRLKFAVILPQFKSRCLFLTQVLSESRHQNKDYFPIQARASEQLWVKSFLNDYGTNKMEIGEQFGEEWLRVLEAAEIRDPELFLEQFEGHHKTKKTMRQIATDKQMDEVELYITFQQDWTKLISSIDEKKSEFPLFAKIQSDLTKNAGLCSVSAQETYQLWSQGLSLEEIVNQRRLKASTINDHFTEMAILYQAFPFEQFLTADQVAYIESMGARNQKIDYEDIKQLFPDVSFFQSRLMQVKGDMSK